MRNLGSRSLFLVLCSCIMAASGCNWDSSSYDEFVKNNDTMVVCPPGSIKSLPDGERTESAGYYIEFTSINCYEDKIVKKGGSEVDSACSGCNDNEKSEYRYCLGYQHQNNNDVFKEGKIKLSFVGSYSNTDNQITAYKDMDKGLCPADYPRCTYVESQGLFGCIDKCPDNLVECDGACIDPNTNPVYCGAKGACTSSDPRDDNYEGMKCDDGEVCANGSCNLNCPAGQIKCKNKNNNNDEVICVKPSENDYCGAKGTCNLSEIDDDNTAGGSCKPEKFERCLPDGDSYKCQVVCPEQMILINENGESYCDTPCPSGQIKCLYDLDTESNYNYSIGSETSEVDEETDNSEDSKTLQSREKGKNYCIFPYSDLDFCGAAGNCTNNGDGNSMGMQCDVKAGQTCIQTNSGKFECGCGEGKVYYSDGNGKTKCLDPKSDLNCGATESDEGENCGDVKRCRAVNESEEVYKCQCPAGMVECDGKCISPETDLEHCGASADCNDTNGTSGQKCEGNKICLKDGDSYRCGIKCAEDQNKCTDANNDEICVNPRNNAMYCGKKEDVCALYVDCTQTGRSCVDGECLCPKGQTFCYNYTLNTGSCVDLSSSHENCGSCGNACNDHQNCVNSECVYFECTEDLALCVVDGKNVCLDVKSDLNNCGGCGAKCPERAGSDLLACVNGNCQYQCAEGYTNCKTGCFNITKDPDHCGGCAEDGDTKDFICGDNQYCASSVCKNSSCGTGVCLNSEGQCKNSSLACGTRCTNCDSLNADEAKCVSIADKTEVNDENISAACDFTKCKAGFHPESIDTTGVDTNGIASLEYICVANTDMACASADIPSDGIIEIIDCSAIVKNEDGIIVGTAACTADGECLITCNAGYHLLSKERKSSGDDTGDKCVQDSIALCNGVYCEDLVGWKSGECIKGKCDITECQPGYHLKEGQCISDTIYACGNKEDVCITIEHWANGECDAGSCKVLECQAGHHIKHDETGYSCEANTITNCGLTTSVTTSNCTEMANSATQTCDAGICSVTVCANGYHLKQDEATGGYICEKNSPTVCGAVNSAVVVDCNTTLTNSAQVECNDGLCSAKKCASGYHLTKISENNRCDSNSNSSCGKVDGYALNCNIFRNEAQCSSVGTCVKPNGDQYKCTNGSNLCMKSDYSGYECSWRTCQIPYY